jgi:hypothetical protein
VQINIASILSDISKHLEKLAINDCLFARPQATGGPGFCCSDRLMTLAYQSGFSNRRARVATLPRVSRFKH